MTLPKELRSNIEQQSGLSLHRSDTVSGGDINQASKLTFEDGSTCFLKWNLSPQEFMFETEARGLKLLREGKSGLKIPETLSVDSHYLMLEWIEDGNPRPESAFQFGVQLARLHRTTSDQFGLDHNNYIGRLAQSNTQHQEWPTFFIRERIEPQLKAGIDSGKLDTGILRYTDPLFKNAESLFPTEPPALLHGDLWSGNYMFTQNGQASLYDPAVYFGHREMDLSMTRLFGGFPADFYRGYQEEYPLDKGFQDRVTLCNLYPILVHCNLFGGSYCRQALSILKEYA